MDLTLAKLWKQLKLWRKIPIGPVAFFYRLGRNVPVSDNNRRQRNRERSKHDLRRGNDVVPPRSIPNVAHSEPKPQGTGAAETALVVGVGPGYGYELARRFARAGMRVVIASRNAERLDGFVRESAEQGYEIVAFGCDATDEQSVQELFSRVNAEFGIPEVVVYAVQAFCPGNMINVEVSAFEESWRQNCLGGFIVAREAARSMMTLKRGSIILTGSTSSIIGRAAHLNLAVGKFGLRALAQVLSREVWPFGIHVAHVIIDADLKENDLFEESYPQANPQDIANAVFDLHRQPKTAWTSEMDFRPFDEKFWEHC